MRPALVNHDGEDDKGDNQKFHEQFIDGAVTSQHIDNMKANRNNIYSVTGKSLIPECLNLVKGTVDSDEPALNDSWEIVQPNMILRVIKMNLVKECFEMSAGINEKNDEYKKFYEQIAECVNDTVVSDDSALNDSRAIA